MDERAQAAAQAGGNGAAADGGAAGADAEEDVVDAEVVDEGK
jgi:hypothetical protein